MAKNTQNKKGAPRSMEDARRIPSEATRCSYSNPSKGKDSGHGTPREKL
ncbi:MAG: hypothetical protein ABH851_04975 [Methanobacteriota archaeon]